jgi:hypothetical protein
MNSVDGTRSRLAELVAKQLDGINHQSVDTRNTLYEELRERFNKAFDARGVDRSDEGRQRALADLENSILANERRLTSIAAPVPVPAVTPRKYTPLPPETLPVDARATLPPSLPPSRRSGMMYRLVTAFALVGAASIAAAVWAAFAGPGLTNVYRSFFVAGHVAERQPAFERNAAMLEELRQLIETHKRTKGTYPATPSGSIGPLNRIVDQITSETAKYPSILPDSGARVLYASNGTEYKLLVYYSGNCFVARLTRPELVDIGRARGPMDCDYFGFWSSGGGEL